MWNSLRRRFRSALRYKLLALVLLPLVAAMAVTLGYTLYWFHGYTRESLNVALRDHVVAAQQALHRLATNRRTNLRRLAESASFRALLARGDGPAIRRALERLRDADGYAFLHLTGVAGNWLYEDTGPPRTSKPSPLTDRAARGFAGAAFEVFRAEDLRRESPALAARARVDGEEERGLILRLTQPIVDDRGRVGVILDAGLLLNRNHAALHSLAGRVFAAAPLPSGADPVVALSLDDVRVAASGSGWSGLIGSRVAPPPEDHRDIAVGRERLHDRAYISAYGRIYDVDDQPVGLLQVGVRPEAFSAGYYRSAALLLTLFLFATAIAAWIAVRGARSLLKPIETMAAVVRATQAGEDRRIGPIGARDEIGELARQFDAMLDQLAARNREIQRCAAALETTVAERTRELTQKNAELSRTIELLEKTQQHLVMADKLSALGKMAAGIAHEINNPAAVIVGNLDVLTAELGAAAQPVAREIDLIARQVERIRHIVTSLLQFARARPGTNVIVDLSANQLVRDVLPLVAHVLKTKSIALHTRLEARGTVAVNPFDLQQVLINLISNAANACDAGGVIRVTTTDRDDGCIVSVRDNGCGIAQSDLARVFDPFFSTDAQRGAGLGLSVSYGLVQRYGGRITVESAVGAGSVFHVWLRRRPGQTAEAAEAPHPTNPEDEVKYG